MAAGFSVTISATDRASSSIDAVNKRLAAMRAPAERLQKSFQRFGDLSGFNKVADGFKNIAQTALGAMRNVARVVEPLAAITGALSLAGMYRLVQAWGQFGTQLGVSASRIGIAADKLNALQGAAALAGSSGEALTSGLQSLGQTMYDAVGGRASEAAALFNQLGISFDDGTRHARKVADVLPQLADKIAAIKDPYTQARIATELFGSAGEALLPFLRKGAAGIAEYQEKARKFGVTNQAGVDGANKIRESFASVQLAVSGLSNSISEKLAPVMGPLLDQFANWISANREWISTQIGQKVKEFGDWVKQIDFKGMLADLRSTLHTANDVAQAFGGWKNIVVGIIGLKLAGWAAGAAAPIISLLRMLALVPGSGVGASSLAAVGIPALGAAAVAVPLAVGLEHASDWVDTQIPGQAGYVAAHRGANNRSGAGGNGDINLRRNTRPGVSSIWANNNPTNLAYYPGQPGVLGANGRWGVYATPEEGVASGLHQMLMDQDRGYNTIRKELNRRSPGNENNTALMIRNISAWSGIDPDAPMNLRDPETARKFLAADIRQESHPIDDKTLNKGISLALGEGAAGATGKVDVKITVAGQAQQVTARSTGAVNKPKIASTGVGVGSGGA